jgi:hypothetical protein
VHYYLKLHHAKSLIPNLFDGNKRKEQSLEAGGAFCLGLGEAVLVLEQLG